jgi:hypothetical protein
VTGTGLRLASGADTGITTRISVLVGIGQGSTKSGERTRRKRRRSRWGELATQRRVYIS